MEAATITALVPAAGCGARTGLNRNKILAPLCGQPILSWTLRALMEAAPRLETLGLKLSQILIAARREEHELLHPLIAHHSSLITFAPGGAHRQQSVANAARAAQSDFLLIHDAARPLVSPALIARVAQSALQNGAAIAALPASDTIKIAREENGVAMAWSTPERATIWHAQTPQIFRRELFLNALENAERDDYIGTDCASLVERGGGRVALVEGETENFKVTFAEDFSRAETILKARLNALN